MLISVNRHSKRPPNNFGGLVDCFGSFLVGDLTLLNSIKNHFKWCAQGRIVENGIQVRLCAQKTTLSRGF